MTEEKSVRPLCRETGKNLYEWLPGNMTCYQLALTETDRGGLLTWLDKSGMGGISFLFIDDLEFVGVEYFMEKMRLRLRGDATALLDFAIHMGLLKGYDR